MSYLKYPALVSGHEDILLHYLLNALCYISYIYVYKSSPFNFCLFYEERTQFSFFFCVNVQLYQHNWLKVHLFLTALQYHFFPILMSVCGFLSSLFTLFLWYNFCPCRNLKLFWLLHLFNVFWYLIESSLLFVFLHKNILAISI